MTQIHEIALVTEDNDVFVVEGERDTLNGLLDKTFSEAYVPLKPSWKKTSELYPIPLHSDVSQERNMGSEVLVYGEAEYSNPDDNDGSFLVDLDFREYPKGTYDIFELTVDGDAEHISYSNLEGKVRNRL